MLPENKGRLSITSERDGLFKGMRESLCWQGKFSSINANT